MLDVSKVLENKFFILSIVGIHAGEILSYIFSRKQTEIDNAGKTFWLIKSFRAKTKQIQQIGRTASNNSQKVYCFFIVSSQKEGAQPTKSISKAKQFSNDKINWLNIPNHIKVTGKIDHNTTGLVLDKIDIAENTKIDLWQYSDFFNNSKSVRMSQGASSVCAVKKYNRGMKSRYRDVIGIGRLKAPYAVYLK